MRRLADRVAPAPAHQTPRPGSYPLMDSVRAIAALSIFAFHVAGQYELSGVAGDLAATLTAGVPIFFVVSGFLLYRPFALAHLTGRPLPATTAFLWRRALRIVPAFWVALTVVLLVGDTDVTANQALALFGFAQVYDPQTVGLGLAQAWSLDCEVVYYVMIPLVILAAVWRGPDDLGGACAGSGR